MNKTNKKLVVVIVALALALVASFGGTLALLTAKTPGLVNTFVATAGLIQGGTTNFTLTETGATGDQNSGYSQTYQGFIPGDKLQKDPKVNITTGVSASAYVFVEIVESNNTATIGGVPGTKIITYTVNTTVWELVPELVGNHGGAVYVYKASVGTGLDHVLAKDAKITDAYILVGEGDGDLENGFVKVTDFSDSEVTTNPSISFYGYAMQSLADGEAYENLKDAYETAFGVYVAP